jgi:hypothetical protein
MISDIYITQGFCCSFKLKWSSRQVARTSIAHRYLGTCDTWKQIRIMHDMQTPPRTMCSIFSEERTARRVGHSCRFWCIGILTPDLTEVAFKVVCCKSRKSAVQQSEEVQQSSKQILSDDACRSTVGCQSHLGAQNGACAEVASWSKLFQRICLTGIGAVQFFRGQGW